MATTNVTSEKQIATNKENVIAKRKEEIKNSSSKMKKILDTNLEELDTTNLLDLIAKNNLSVKREANAKFQMYKFERESLTDKEEKKKRTQIRKKRNKIIDNIIYYFQNQKEKELKAEIKEFNSFYTKEYLLNDYSIKSIASDNSDEQTKEKIKIMFEIIKRIK